MERSGGVRLLWSPPSVLGFACGRAGSPTTPAAPHLVTHEPSQARVEDTG